MSGEENVKAAPPWMMTRLELSADDWAAVRTLAIKERVTTQRLLADIVRAALAETGEAA